MTRIVAVVPTTEPTMDPTTRHRLSVVVLSYATPPAMLETALRSVLDSVGVGPSDPTVLAEIVVADNASPIHRGEAEALVRNLALASDSSDTSHIAVRWLPFDRNHGFAGGINRGLAAADPTCDVVFLLNPDAVVEPDALYRLGAALAGADPRCVAAVPKMLLASDPTVIDAVGNAVNGKGEAFNLGLGQPDLGQYDTPSHVFGACFGAALFRRWAFASEHVGPLDESLFLYYEDVDWNWRSQLLGYHSVTEPSARVRHVMSAASRHLDYGFKFHLTERNLLLCVLKNFAWRRALGIWFRRGGGLLKGSVRGHYPLPGLKAVAGALRRAPGALLARRRIQRRRVRTDGEVLAYADGERTFFDAVRYEPTDRVAAEAYARARRQQFSR